MFQIPYGLNWPVMTQVLEAHTEEEINKLAEKGKSLDLANFPGAAATRDCRALMQLISTGDLDWNRFVTYDIDAMCDDNNGIANYANTFVFAMADEEIIPAVMGSSKSDIAMYQIAASFHMEYDDFMNLIYKNAAFRWIQLVLGDEVVGAFKDVKAD